MSIFDDLEIKPTYFAVEGDDYNGVPSKFGSRVQNKVIKSGFSGIQVMSLVSNPDGSDEPNYDSFASASLGYTGGLGETLLCLAIEERFCEFAGVKFEHGNQADALPTDVGFHRGADSLRFPGGNLNVNPGNGSPMPTEFPGVPNLNGGAYKQLENTLRNLSNRGNTVNANFESIFNETNLTRRPDAFRVTYNVNGGMPRVRSFLNQPGG